MQRAGTKPTGLCIAFLSLCNFRAAFVQIGTLEWMCHGEGEMVLGRAGEGVCQFCGMPAVLKQRTFELVCYHGKLEEY